jgi:F420-dependent oxidoreductase-like protein
VRIGVVLGRPGGSGDSWDGLRDQYERGRRAQLSTLWLTQHLGFDALSVFAAWGSDRGGPELGTAVVPVPPRHPLVLAQQALTVQAATAGRLALGLGLGHRRTLDDSYGVSTPRSIEFMRDYLSVLNQLLAGGKPPPNGAFPLRGRLLMSAPAPPPVLLAALGPRMLALAGEMATGTITWMTGPRTVAEHVIPAIKQAAADRGRPEPRIVVCLPIAVTDDESGTRDYLTRANAYYADIPSYRNMLQREGVTQPGYLAVVGNEAAAQAALEDLAAVGVTDFGAIIEGLSPADVDRTWDFLADRGH